MSTKTMSSVREAPRSTIRASKEALESELALRLLSTIEGDRSVSQRSLALRLGIAVGLTNAYLKRCVRKGWVKVGQIPARRYAYYLTPTGFSEKSRLVAEYLSSSFGFFRRARAQCGEALRHCEARGWRRVALAGEGDLADIATLAAREVAVELVMIIAPGSNVETAAGLPVVANLDSAREVDAVLLTDIRAAQATYEALREWLPDERILTPELLRISRTAGEETPA